MGNEVNLILSYNYSLKFVIVLFRIDVDNG